MRMSRAGKFRAALAVIFALGALLVESAFGQVPIPLQEQVQLFQSLPAAQQQALIREMQRDLPPAQREAILQMLQGSRQGQQPQPTQAPARGARQDESEDDDVLFNQDLMRALNAREPRFGAGDTLVLRFQRRPRQEGQPPPDEAEQTRLGELMRRLEEGNPYKLDSNGVLYLPGVPSIAVAGLNAAQATTRIEAEPSLQSFDVTLTRLPLEPVGTEALKPFGYELFRDNRSGLQSMNDVPAPADYVVGPGDTINVQLFGNQNAEYFLVVSREGSVSIPQIGPINVSGLTFTEMRNTLIERVTEQMIGVRASVTLGELRSIRVFVLGEVERPGLQTVNGLSTMTNALLASGGIREIGSLRNVALRRGGETVATLDLYDLLLRGDTSDDSRLQPGDVIFVPPVGDTVAVDGEVKRPAIYEIRGESTVADLVSLAGGLTPHGDGTAVKLERVVAGRGTTVRDIDITSAPGRAEVVRDGDVLRVLRNLDQLENSVRLEGNVYQPGLYEWRPGMRLGDLLSSPALVKPMSDLNYVLVRREVRPNVETQVLSVDLESVWRGDDADFALEERDTVYVFNLEIGREHIIEPMIQEIVAQARPNEPQPVVRIAGQVRAPGRYPLEPGMTVSDLLRAGGGLSAAAYGIEAELTRYSVVNGEYRETELMPVDLDAILAGDPGADTALAPYDYVSIKEVPRWSEQETVTILGEVVFPGGYPIRQGEMLSSVLERAGGLTEYAFPEGSVFTRRELREREQEQIETLARRIENDLAALSLSDPAASEAITTGQALINQLRNSVATGRLVIRLDDLVAGQLSADILLKDGDQLIVPERSQEVTVLGEVQYATSHVFSRNLDREDYIGMSGGLTRDADKSRIYVVRANGEVVAEPDKGWFRRRGNLEIRPGDTIVVPRDVERVRPLARWSSVTQVVYNLAIAAAAVNSF